MGLVSTWLRAVMGILATAAAAGALGPGMAHGRPPRGLWWLPSRGQALQNLLASILQREWRGRAGCLWGVGPGIGVGVLSRCRVVSLRSRKHQSRCFWSCTAFVRATRLSAAGSTLCLRRHAAARSLWPTHSPLLQRAAVVVTTLDLFTMLVAMTFNGVYFAAVVLGYGLGTLAFSHLRHNYAVHVELARRRLVADDVGAAELVAADGPLMGGCCAVGGEAELAPMVMGRPVGAEGAGMGERPSGGGEANGRGNGGANGWHGPKDGGSNGHSAADSRV
jgi:hypothetical protein